MPVDGRRFVLHALAVLALLGVVVSTGWVISWAGFTFDPEGPSPTMVRQEAMAATIGCALLAAAFVPLRLARMKAWLLAIDAALAALLGLLAVVLINTRAHGHDPSEGNPWTWVVWMFLIAPTTWPLLGLLLATPLLRGRSRRAPR